MQEKLVYNVGMKRFACMMGMLLLPLQAQALSICECKDRSFEHEQRHAFAIFVGTVDKIKRELNPDKIRVEFNVHKSWKGVRHKEVEVLTAGTDLLSLAREGITCGYKFTEGQTYLVYSYRKSNTRGPSWVGSCGRTKLYFDAQADLERLGEPEQTFAPIDIQPRPQSLGPTKLPEATPLPEASPSMPGGQ